MRRYYFDVRDGKHLIPDEEGLELPTIEAAWGEAALSLADLAMDEIAMPGTKGREDMAIEVRDGDGLVLEVKLTFAVEPRRHSNRAD
jgi:hypothetical protein